MTSQAGGERGVHGSCEGDCAAPVQRGCPLLHAAPHDVLWLYPRCHNTMLHNTTTR